MKVGGVENESLAVAELTNYILEELALKKDRIVVFGPGSTCLAIKLAYGLEGTLLGCDALLADGEKLKDLTSADLLALRNKSALHLVLSFTRNQGFLFGRGNQQISSQLIRKLKISEDLTIVSSRTKLASLKGLPLLVDTGDTELDAELSGIYPILTGYDEFLLYRIAQDFQPED
jgi:predicted polyphosphate/ATP-dependent NAD kinase